MMDRFRSYDDARDEARRQSLQLEPKPFKVYVVENKGRFNVASMLMESDAPVPFSMIGRTVCGFIKGRQFVKGGRE